MNQIFNFIENNLGIFVYGLWFAISFCLGVFHKKKGGSFIIGFLIGVIIVPVVIWFINTISNGSTKNNKFIHYL